MAGRPPTSNSRVRSTSAAMDVNDDVLDLVLERVDSHVSLIRAAAVCRRWRRAIADAAFLRRYRSLHAPAAAGYYHNPGLSPSGKGRIPEFVPSSPSMVDARHFSLDFLPGGAGSWTILDGRGSLLLLRRRLSYAYAGKFSDKVVCEPLTRRYRSIPPLPDWNSGYFWEFLLDGESNEGGGGISMSNFRVLSVFRRKGVTDAAMYAVGVSSWTKKNIDPSLRLSVCRGHGEGCWYFLHGRVLITLDGSTGDFSSSELPPLDLEGWDPYTLPCDFFITKGRDGMLHIFTVFDESMKMFTKLEGGEWALEKRVMLPEATCGLPGYEPSFFSGPQTVSTIGAGFVILRPDIGKPWPFSINLETMEASPAEVGMGPLAYECKLPWPPALHACLDR